MGIVDWFKRSLERFNASPFGRLLQSFGQRQGALLAGAVAYSILFSLFPIILALLSIAGFVLRDPAAYEQARSAILSILPPGISEAVDSALTGISQQAGVLAIISFATFLWAGSGLFGALEAVLDDIYSAQVRPFVQQKLMSFAMIFVFAIAILLVVGGSTVSSILYSLGGQAGVSSTAIGVGAAIVSRLIILAAAFGLCFAILYVVPNVRLPFREVWPGAAFAAIAFVLLTQLFPIYVRITGGGAQYGALFGLFFVLMIWNYFVALVILFGGELNAFLYVQTPPASQPTGQAAAEAAPKRRKSRR